MPAPGKKLADTVEAVLSDQSKGADHHTKQPFQPLG
jgi:hypothetical protein